MFNPTRLLAGSLNLPDGKRVVDALPNAYQRDALAMRGVLEPAHSRSQMTIAY